MAVVSDITTVANATAAAHGYTLTTYAVTNQGQVRQIAKLGKFIPQPTSGYFEFYGLGDSSSLTTAKTNALAALNANRRHRYAGSPGLSSGATVAADSHGDTHTVDVN